MKKSMWGEFGSFWGFLCNRQPGVPSVLDIAAMSARADIELKRELRRLRMEYRKANVPWDEKP